MENIVLSVVGADRPGILSELSAAVNEAGGNWLESAMSNLSGTFAGAVLVSIAKDKVDGLSQAINALDGMTVTVAKTNKPADTDGQVYELHVVGNDHPGIISEITRVLHGKGATIHQLHTLTSEAPMDNSRLFEAIAFVELPEVVSDEELQEALEALAAELQVDIDFADADDEEDENDHA